MIGVAGFRAVLVVLSQTLAIATAPALEIGIRELGAQAPAVTAEQRPGQLPGSRIARGERDIAAAWLAGATARYAHGVLGDRFEASRLVVETSEGRTLVHELPESRVFEDLFPRLADLNGDGEDEILVVETHVDRGASLAVYVVSNARLARRAATPFLGQSNRWLNPLGIGDFDGDGRPDIALVATPHIGGRLRLYHFTTPTLTQFAEIDGVSTHSIASRELELGRVVRTEHRDRVLLPDQSHATLLLLEWSPQGIREIARKALPTPIVTSLHATGTNRWRFRTADGRHLEVHVKESRRQIP